MLTCILAKPAWWEVSDADLPQSVECNVDINIFSAGFLTTLSSLLNLESTDGWGLLDYLGLSLLSFFGAAQKLNMRRSNDVAGIAASLKALVKKMEEEDEVKLARKGKGRALSAALTASPSPPPAGSAADDDDFDDLHVGMFETSLQDADVATDSIEAVRDDSAAVAAATSSASTLRIGARRSSTPWDSNLAPIPELGSDSATSGAASFSRESSTLSDPPPLDEEAEATAVDDGSDDDEIILDRPAELDGVGSADDDEGTASTGRGRGRGRGFARGQPVSTSHGSEGRSLIFSKEALPDTLLPLQLNPARIQWIFRMLRLSRKEGNEVTSITMSLG